MHLLQKNGWRVFFWSTEPFCLWSYAILRDRASLNSARCTCVGSSLRYNVNQVCGRDFVATSRHIQLKSHCGLSSSTFQWQVKQSTLHLFNISGFSLWFCCCVCQRSLCRLGTGINTPSAFHIAWCWQPPQIGPHQVSYEAVAPPSRMIAKLWTC